ncbi:MAG: putative nucleotide binding protein [Haloarculaceae archaeon]|jgi:putative nucleotide binding protein
MSEDDPEDRGDGQAVVLDFLPHGRTEDDRPQYQKQPLAYAMGVDSFRLYELVVDDDSGVTIGDRIDIYEESAIQRVNDVEYDDLSSGASSELDYAVEDLVEAEEERFVDFYNDAQPITLRLHQLNLLPGIGKKLRNSILDQRKRRPFDGFDDLESRVDGLHNPREVLVERIIEELREDDLKYRTFVGHDSEE